MDPKSIVRRGDPYDFWISEDWSSSSDTKQPGLRQVRAIDVVYADGSRSTMVLDERGQPISPIRDLSPDDAQTRIWQQQQQDAKPPGGIPTRTINGQVFNWNPATRAYDIPTGDPPATASTTAAPGGKPFIDDGPEAGAAGRRWGWNPETRLYDRNLGPSPSAQKPPETKPAGPKGDLQTIGGRVKEFNPQTGKYDIDHGPAGADAKPTGTLVERNGRTFIVKPDGSPAVEVPGLPADAPKGTLVERQDGTYLVSADGRSATKVQGLPPKEPPKRYSTVSQDPDSKAWWGLTPEGKWERMEGGPGASAPDQAAGPAMPTIIVGQSEAALRAYADKLTAEVSAGRMTPKRREELFKQAMEMAQHAVREATLIQSEREAAMNAQVNLATTRANSMTTGLQNAMKFALDLNDKLPSGSPLGGQAFAAMLGLHMLAAKQSGLYDITPPGADQTSLAGRGIGAAAQAATRDTASIIAGLKNPADPKAIAEARQMTAAQIRADPLLAAEVAGSQAQAAAVQRWDQPPSAAGAPAPTPTPAPAPVAGATAPSPVAVPDAGAAYNPALAAPTAAPVGAPDDVIAVRSKINAVDRFIRRSEFDPNLHTEIDPNSPTLRGAPRPMAALDPAQSPPLAQALAPTGGAQSADIEWDGRPGTGPGMSVPPVAPPSPPLPQLDPEKYGHTDDNPMIPGGSRPTEMLADFPVLSQYRPQPIPPPPPPVGGTPPAVLYTRAASTPFWQLDSAAIDEMLAAGVPEDVIRSDGRRRIA